MHNKTSQEIKAGKNLAAAMLVKFLEMNSCKEDDVPESWYKWCGS